jgi:prepilin-type N-terminal cleavage/methylation domain-containing protein
MKTPSRRHPAAFTLIELMAVVTIIVILAGLVIGGMGYVNEKQASEKAKVQISLLSKALEDYKLDNGTYPPTGNSANPTANTNLMFRALYWEGASDATGAKKIYLPELDPVNNKQGWISGTGQSATIVDPWGNQYRYRTAFSGASTPVANPDTQNPDFDLWSMGKDGKTRAGRNDAPNHADNRDDIRNF